MGIPCPKAPPIPGGPSGRPRDEAVGPTGRGLPDETGRPAAVDAARIERTIRAL